MPGSLYPLTSISLHPQSPNYLLTSWDTIRTVSFSYAFLPCPLSENLSTEHLWNWILSCFCRLSESRVHLCFSKHRSIHFKPAHLVSLTFWPGKVSKTPHEESAKDYSYQIQFEVLTQKVTQWGLQPLGDLKSFLFLVKPSQQPSEACPTRS
jgi:hypothetical protein